jgi:hypothetical protein
MNENELELIWKTKLIMLRIALKKRTPQFQVEIIQNYTNARRDDCRLTKFLQLRVV